MPDMERLTDKMSVDIAPTEEHRQYALGFIAGKKRARYEVLAVVVSLYFIIAMIGKFAGDK